MNIPIATVKAGDMIRFSDSGHVFIVKKIIEKRDLGRVLHLSRGNHSFELVIESQKGSDE